jgi:pSer/pThr/pTyr-binding forkhead associated (FHA) protein
MRSGFSANFKRIYLQEERRLAEFDLTWQPAIIGRRDQRDPSKNKLLAAPLDELEESNTVSRHHACITEKSGAFFIEALNSENATYLEGQRLRVGTPYPIEPGKSIQLGRLTLKFHVVS